MSRLCAVVAILSIAAAQAQMPGSPSLKGTVTDPSGAAVPNAVVQVRGVPSGPERRARTDRSGAYSFPALAPGNYQCA